MFKKFKSIINTLKSKWLAQNLDHLTSKLVNSMVNYYSPIYVLDQFKTLSQAENFEKTKNMLYHVIIPKRVDANGKRRKIKGGNLLHIACATEQLELAEKLIETGFSAVCQDEDGHYPQDYLITRSDNQNLVKRIYNQLNSKTELNNLQKLPLTQKKKGKSVL